MKKTPSFVFFFMLAVLLSACVATSGIVSTHDITVAGVNPLQYKTYAWYQEQPLAEAAYDEGYTSKLHKNIKQAVEEELKQRGFRKVETNPDLLVAYDVSVSVPLEKDNPENFAPGFGYSYGFMSGFRYDYSNSGLPGYRAVDLFKAGTLIIDFVHPERNELLWRGWTEGAINNFNAGYKKVHKQVEEVLKELNNSN